MLTLLCAKPLNNRGCNVNYVCIMLRHRTLQNVTENYCLPLCLSVCLSVTIRYCVERVELETLNLLSKFVYHLIAELIIV